MGKKIKRIKFFTYYAWTFVCVSEDLKKYYSFFKINHCWGLTQKWWFGAFSDKDFVKDPNDFLEVGQDVKVKVVSIDERSGRIGLNMVLWKGFFGKYYNSFLIQKLKDMLKKMQDAFLWEAEKRITNPFIGAFIIAWIFWNWDFIYAFFFLDQQYVSIKYAWNWDFFTKVEYLKMYWLYNYWDFLWNPFWSGLLVYIGIEWGSTLINICVEWVKNKILKIETVTSEEYQKIKEKIVAISKERREEKSQYIEENLKLTDDLSEVNNKITEKAREIAKKNIEKKDIEIGILQKDIDNRDERIKQLKEEIVHLNDLRGDLSAKNYNLELTLQDCKAENLQLKEEIKKKTSWWVIIDNEQEIEKEYNLFKQTKYFYRFKQLIELLEDNQEKFLHNFDIMAKKYCETKWIIRKEEQSDYNGNIFYYYVFTDKWNKFVEYYLDENDSDIPF